MIELLRLVLLLAIAATAMTFLGSAAAWWMDERRRMWRIVRRVLGGSPDGVIVAQGRGAAAGFRLASRQVLVMRDGGADALLYPIRSLAGAELIVDDQVVARTLRDEPRQALNLVDASASRVTLRLLFDDARHPDFSLDLWMPGDTERRDARPKAAVIREARTWLTRAEAIMRRAAPPPPAVDADDRPAAVSIPETGADDAGPHERDIDDDEQDYDDETDQEDFDPPRLL